MKERKITEAGKKICIVRKRKRDGRRRKGTYAKMEPEEIVDRGKAKRSCRKSKKGRREGVNMKIKVKIKKV